MILIDPGRVRLGLAASRYRSLISKRDIVRELFSSGTPPPPGGGGSYKHMVEVRNIFVLLGFAASKTARIDCKDDSKTFDVAKIGKNGYFSVKCAQDLQLMYNAEIAQETKSPNMRESHTTALLKTQILLSGQPKSYF